MIEYETLCEKAYGKGDKGRVIVKETEFVELEYPKDTIKCKECGQGLHKNFKWFKYCPNCGLKVKK